MLCFEDEENTNFHRHHHRIFNFRYFISSSTTKVDKIVLFQTYVHSINRIRSDISFP